MEGIMEESVRHGGLISLNNFTPGALVFHKHILLFCRWGRNGGDHERICPTWRLDFPQ